MVPAPTVDDEEIERDNEPTDNRIADRWIVRRQNSTALGAGAGPWLLWASPEATTPPLRLPRPPPQHRRKMRL